MRGWLCTCWATRRQREHIEDVLCRSVAAGASIVCGGRAPPDKPAGWYFEPTIVIASEADSQSESLRSRKPDVLMGHQLIKLPDPRPGNEGRADLSHADMVILAGD